MIGTVEIDETRIASYIQRNGLFIRKIVAKMVDTRGIDIGVELVGKLDADIRGVKTIFLRLLIFLILTFLLRFIGQNLLTRD